MNRHVYNLPHLVEFHHHSRVLVRLEDEVSDLALLGHLANPLAEIVVNQCQPLQARFIIKQAPFICIELQEWQQATINECSSVSRSLGQGFRLFLKLGHDPRQCIEELREGVIIYVELGDSVRISLANNSRFELLEFEQDFRQLKLPESLIKAQSIVEREFTREESTGSLALQITELEQVRAEISQLLKSDATKINHSLSKELMKYDHLLHSKRQWLFRSYQQTLDRPNLNTSANQPNLEVEKLQHKLDCFNLLAPKSVVEMVDKLAEES
ncbi:hypothetical protein EXU30_01225 [Shewanella maritima]|uniref:Uncharacterized protein n=1 Tax=Shewanella maritima TaxID=2520507 RepID=A0A411PCZ4_9GAMM|nr:hypothetical protein [Shewanella maritima]QBF81467.1 hypothetical protein EXU30_01225 [Shewanella maritima]